MFVFQDWLQLGSYASGHCTLIAIHDRLMNSNITVIVKDGIPQRPYFTVLALLVLSRSLALPLSAVSALLNLHTCSVSSGRWQFDPL